MPAQVGFCGALLAKSVHRISGITDLINCTGVHILQCYFVLIVVYAFLFWLHLIFVVLPLFVFIGFVATVLRKQNDMKEESD